MRLYPLVLTTPKWTGNTPSSLTYNGQTYHIPPYTHCGVNSGALHYIKEYWGPDVATFNPHRWDRRNTSSFLARNDGKDGLNAPGLEYENIHKPVGGAYIAFSDGPTACIEKTFAQAEFVAVFAVIFGRFRVRLATSGGQSEEDARRGAQKTLKESSAFLALTMRDDVPLLFEER